MDKLKIRTNRQPRETVRWYELTAKERAEFDYLDTEERQSDAEFVRYKGWTYDLAEFMRVPPGADEMAKWDGYHGDSYFSGVLVKWVDDNERVIMATYFS